jgi:hypothetical protein
VCRDFTKALHCCNKVLEIINFERGKVNFGLWFWGPQSVTDGFYHFDLGGYSALWKECVVEEICLPHN